MRKLLTMLLFLGLATPALGQATCACPALLDTTLQRVRRNYAGFADKVTARTRSAHNQLADSLRRAAPAQLTDSSCHVLVRTYTRWFRDGHLGMQYVPRRKPRPASAPLPPTAPAAPAPGHRPDPDVPVVALLQPGWLLLRIPSFDLRYKDTLRHLLRHYERQLAATPNWVLDVRGNDGGARDVYAPLLPYLYTNPIVEDGAKTWCSPDNVRAAREEYDDYQAQVDSATRTGWRRGIERMAAHRGQWLASSGDTIRQARVLAYPRRVAIVVDKGCASSTEIFLLKAQQSSKVRLYGQPTNGTVDYGDVKYWDDLPCPGFTLRVATSRWDWLDRRGPVDGTGLMPAVRIPSTETDWISYVLTH